MRLIAFVFALLALGAPAWAQQGFQSDYQGGYAGPIAIGEIAIGEDLAEKAEAYGQREIDFLVEDLREALEQDLARVGRLDEAGGGAVLNLTIVDAQPNRPTFEQLSGTPGLSARSFSRGGAEVTAELIGPDGAILGTYAYAYETRNIRDAQFQSTWGDATRTFDRFATRFVDDLQGV